MSKPPPSIRIGSQLIVLFLLIHHLSIAQPFSDKNYYLLDSVDIKTLVEKDRALLDSCLGVFHSTADDLTKLSAISSYVERESSNALWMKYNAFLDHFISELPIENFNSSQRKKIKEYYAEVLTNYGIEQDNIGNQEKAIKWYLDALTINKEINSQEGMGENYNNLACIYHNQGKITQALEYFDKAVHYFTLSKNIERAAFTYSNIGVIYNSINDRETAINYYYKALEQHKKINEQSGIAICLNNIGNIKLDQKKPQEALTFFQNAFEINKEQGNKPFMAINLSNQGDAYLALKDDEKSRQLYTESFNISNELHIKFGIARDLNKLAKLDIKINDWKNAETKLIQSHKIATQLNVPSLILESSKLLSTVAKHNGQFEKSLEYYTLHIAMRDSIVNQDNQKNAMKHAVRMEFNKKIIIDSLRNLREKEVLQYKLDNRKSRLQTEQKLRWALIIGVVSLIIWIIVQIHSIRIIRKQKKEIEARNKERERMLWEIHHRVKNNLQVVISIIRLQTYHTDSEMLKVTLEECERRVLTMVKIHENLYGRDQFSRIALKPYFSELLKDILGSYGLQDAVRINIELSDNLTFHMKTLVPLALIVNEVITNTCKHAFKASSKGEIFFSLHELSTDSYTDKYVLKIGDNGVGSSIEEQQELRKSDSFGQELIDVFTDQLDGEIRLETNNGRYYTLTFASQD